MTYRNQQLQIKALRRQILHEVRENRITMLWGFAIGVLTGILLFAVTL